MRKLIPVVAIIAFAWFAVSCGGGGDGGKVVIGVEGGVVTSDDGKLALDIPAGALDEEVEITMTAVPVDDLPEELREVSGPGPAYLLEPDGLEFDEPVAVKLELNRSELDDVPEDGVVAYLLLTQNADGEIESLAEPAIEATLGEETFAVRGELSHFSPLVKSDGYLEVRLQRVPFRQLIEVPFTAVVFFKNISSGTFRAPIAPVFVNSFGVPQVNTVGDIRKPGSVNPGFAEPVPAVYICADPGAGKYGIDTTWRITPNVKFARSFDVTIRGEVDCVTTLAVTDTPTPTDTPEPGVPTDTPPPPTSTLLPPPATSTPVPAGKTPPPSPTGGSTTGTYTDPTGDENVVGGGRDVAVDIRSVSISASGNQTKVFVTLGADPVLTRLGGETVIGEKIDPAFSFAVRVTLGGQIGLLETDASEINDAPPTGGSLGLTSEGVSMIFNKPVPSGVKLLVETFHLKTDGGAFGMDTFTVMLP